MKYWIVSLALVVGLAGAVACAHPNTSGLTPAGQTAYKADLVVLRVNELENAALQANAQGGLAIAPAKTIVQFCVTADQVLKTTPSGWTVTLQTSWDLTKKALGTVSNPAVSAAMSAVDVVLAALVP
jgi:hypothetical protein